MKIGLTQRVLFHKGRAYDSIEQGWYTLLKDHTLSFVQNRIEQDFDTLADDIDLLIITGGNDPLERRITETKLATAMLIKRKPIIGVCHGCFLLTDLLGGKVVDTDLHMDTEHSIIYQEQVYTVNSYHNLGISVEPRGATVLARDSAGNCEAWIDNNIAGIVWHPERMSTPFIPEEILKLL
jgi:gamma-glutamyl-gamma-aminobutyrate hydrolase PuuD